MPVRNGYSTRAGVTFTSNTSALALSIISPGLFSFPAQDRPLGATRLVRG